MRRSGSFQKEKDSVAQEDRSTAEIDSAWSSSASDTDFSHLASQHDDMPFLSTITQTIDLGFTTHMCPTFEGMTSISEDSTAIQLADGSTISTTNFGNLDAGIDDGTKVHYVVVPGLKEPLLSVSWLSNEGIAIFFDSKGCMFILSASSGKMVGRGVCCGGLYSLPNVFPLSCFVWQKHIINLSLKHSQPFTSWNPLRNPLQRLIRTIPGFIWPSLGLIPLPGLTWPYAGFIALMRDQLILISLFPFPAKPLIQQGNCIISFTKSIHSIRPGTPPHW